MLREALEQSHSVWAGGTTVWCGGYVNSTSIARKWQEVHWPAGGSTALALIASKGIPGPSTTETWLSCFPNSLHTHPARLDAVYGNPTHRLVLGFIPR